ncbi:NUDIX hydrolase [Isobaculum melis]|uniref:8-oxo-dGTP diphosphatase n=1 Tax=Isobaculum melis TaxID=142588 RepID=A0A1H9U2C3_9LACT|nr:NUDIX hydrolase [Isobaculum melis]SES03720.1 8-oxo-dGTP diphosphatase [Isobaculum melis]
MEKNNIPIFGKKLQDQTYEQRIGAYMIVADEARKQMILVSPPNGAYFLPGGEIEGQETNEETLTRECMEELGFQVKVGQYLGRSDEYFYSSFRDTYFHNPGYFYVADQWKEKCPPLERFNTLEWFPYEEALLKLKRGSHRWAVAEFIKQLKK